jgi:predicted CopG family antitoxin
MQKKLTITIDEQVYEGLYRKVGRRRISRFMEGLARPHVVDEDFAAAYQAMAADEQREAEAREWVENLAADAPHEAG